MAALKAAAAPPMSVPMVKTSLRAAAAALCLLAVSSCGGSATYDSALDLQKALADNGVDCLDLQTVADPGEGTRDKGECSFTGTSIVLVVLQDGVDPLQRAKETNDLVSQFGMESAVVVGENWIVNATRALVAEQVHEAIGGEIVSA